MARQRLINVSNRLPVTVGETITKSSGGLVAALEGLSKEEFELQWIGWPGAEVEPDRQADVERTLRDEHGCIPLFLSKDEAEAHYEGFSNRSLWPLLHYMPDRFRYHSQWWSAYREVNQKFAQKVLEIARDGDLVWVHDYQLMLLPQMLKEKMPSLRVGYFLHTPFPSYEIFRCHPQREALLEGLLGADQIGFHTFNYLRQFGISVLRGLGIDSQITSIRSNGHTSRLGAYPIGIHGEKFDLTLRSKKFAQQVERLSKAHTGSRLVLSVERMDYTKGLVHRLEAIELFLRESKEPNGVKFVFVSVPSREGIEDYQELREEIQTQVGRLNGEFATLDQSPIHFIHGSVDFAELCALYSVADVCLVTPLVDGMNLVAKEFVAAQQDDPGVLVLSEFAGAAEELASAFIVNPYDPQCVAKCLREALDMPLEERRERMRPMRERVMKFDAQWWARTFIGDLASHDALPSEPTNIETAQGQIRESLKNRQKFWAFIDYDGTLREIQSTPEAAKPIDETEKLLCALQDHPQVNAVLISGRSQEDMERWFGQYQLGLIAEHGAAVRPAGETQWQRADEHLSESWKPALRKLLQVYVDTTPGSLIEEKRSAIVWHYRNAAHTFAAWKARDLTAELAVLLANDPVTVRHGRMIVEVSLAAVSKGAAIAQMLASKQNGEIVLVAGDDETDETMFTLEIANLISIKVGDEDSKATYRLPTPAAFRAFLEQIVR